MISSCEKKKKRWKLHTFYPDSPTEERVSIHPTGDGVCGKASVKMQHFSKEERKKWKISKYFGTCRTGDSLDTSLPTDRNDDTGRKRSRLP
jgi:hypothetical protein